jgi:subfamily B ATP-binding cassette protein MsbA
MEDYEKSRAGILVEKIFKLVFRAARTKAAAYPIMETLGGTAIVIVICYGGWQVIEGTRSTGTFFSFVTALLLAYDPVKKLVNLNAQLQEGLAATERVFRILDVHPKIVDHPNALRVDKAKGNIIFENISFSYLENVPLIDNISLTIKKGQTVALVGHSGAGKTTILNLICRFFDPASGAITLDGTDIRKITMSSLRSNLALVSQDVTLFNDTIKENIAYGTNESALPEIQKAAKHAAAHDFIIELPNGYDTMIGENGVKLSGGQRQRIAIARAMLKNAPILLLDEATSSLDSKSERAVQEALSNLMQNRTTIVVAHRLSTIQSADLIHVIDEGRIAESGNHDELLQLNGAYAKLYEIQFSKINHKMPFDNENMKS